MEHRPPYPCVPNTASTGPREFRTCETCKGTGVKKTPVRLAPGCVAYDITKCQSCKGKGAKYE